MTDHPQILPDLTTRQIVTVNLAIRKIVTVNLVTRKIVAVSLVIRKILFRYLVGAGIAVVYQILARHILTVCQDLR